MRLFTALLLALVPAAARADDALAEAAALHRAGRPLEALAVLDAAPPTTPLARWTVVVGALSALVGCKHVVVTTHGSRGAEPYPPAGPVSGAKLDDGPGVYDFDLLVTGFDAVTGRRLWTRRLPGHNDVALDDRTDAVFAWRERLFKLNPATGVTEAETPMPRRPLRYDALLIDGRLHRPRPNTSVLEGPDEKLAAWDVDRNRPAEFVSTVARLSPDETRAFHVVTGGFGTWVTAKPLRAREPDWKFVHPSPSVGANAPVWLGRDLVVLVGDTGSKAEVIRLNGDTGAVRWRHPLPRGAYHPGGDQLRGGAYPERNWSAVGLCGGFVLAVGGEGTLYVLEPDTGKLAAKITPETKYLTFPRLVDGALVVCGFERIRAIPWDVVLRRGPDDGDRAVLRARCLHDLGRTEAALTALDDVLTFAPERAEAWAVKADASRAADRPFDEIAARCRVLELTGRDTSPELRTRWGLLARVATGHDLRDDAATAGTSVYASTASGALLTIDVRTLAAERSELPAAARGLTATTAVKAYLPENKWHDVTSPTEGGPAKAQAGWNVASGYDGPPVKWNGKWYRPLDRGAVRVLDGDAVTEFPPKVGGLRGWQVHVSPWGPPLGAGAGGVYDLDENLVPVRVRIPAPETQVWQLAGDARTLAVLTHRGAGPHFQVWARDGSKLMREQALAPYPPVNGQYEHVVPLAGGYLYAGGSLAWVPAGDGPAWRFGFGAAPSPPKLHYAHVSLFGRPVVRDGLIFAGCRDGAVYVFDVATVTGR